MKFTEARKRIGRKRDAGRTSAGIDVKMKNLKIEMGKQESRSRVKSSMSSATDVRERKGS
jgi:hypothetical protein